MTPLLFFLLGLGVLLGHFIIPIDWLQTIEWTGQGALYILLFLVGISLGQQRKKLTSLRQMGNRFILIPLATAAGSLIGGLLGSSFTELAVQDGMAIASGMGYYSLAGTMLQQIRGIEIGMVAFLSNFLRESLTFLFVPLLIRIHPAVAIAFGGVTTMDTTLPVIKRFTSNEYTILAFVNGVILTFLAPILINLFTMF